jgi:hypothetical protein
MAGDAELAGVENLDRTLDVAAREIADVTPEERAAGEYLARRGAAAAPRRTGFLASTHGYDVGLERVDVVATAPYATIVHSTNPWLERAVVGAESHVAELYLAGLDRALSQVKGT